MSNGQSSIPHTPPASQGGAANASSAPAGRRLPPHEDSAADSYGTETQRAIRSWIENNETVALLGGFAVGVFVGVLMRR